MTDFQLSDFGLISGIGMGLVLAIVTLSVIQIVLLVVAIISIMKKNVPSGDKILWLLIVLLINIIGPIIYFAVGNSKLEEKEALLENERENR